MSSLPSGISRVPSLLASQINLRQISGTNVSLLKLQTQISSNKRVNRPSDDPIASTLIDRIDRDLANSTQRARNLDHASSTLNTLDQILGQLSTTVNEAKSIASSQVGLGSDATTRKQQAEVVNSLIDSVFASVNRDYAGIQLFGGSRTATRPVEAFNTGYRFLGDTDGLRTDLGESIDFPITLGADAALGSLSSRVKGNLDLNPALSLATKLSDLRGSAQGNQLGSLTITITNGGPPVAVQIDLSNADSIGDVANQLESAIRTADPTALSGTYPGGVALFTDRLGLNLAAGASVTFSDGPSGSTASALALSGFTYDNTNPFNTATTADLNPQLTDRTTLGQVLGGAGASYGDIVFRAGNRTGIVTTSATMTISQFKEAVRRLNLGVRAEIDPSGNSINVLNEVAGQRLSIEEGATGGNAATSLGIRSLMASTPTSIFNDGKGVEIADGAINPITGLPDPAKNNDFTVTLSNGTAFTVDLIPSDLGTVQDVLNKINAAATAAGVSVGVGANQFTATLNTTGNGITLRDTFGGASAVTVTKLNGRAAEDLGLLNGIPTTGNPATLAGSDRTSVRVDSLFSTLIDLRDALLNNDSTGITLAGGRLEADIDRLASARATIGGRTQRVEDAADNLKDIDTLNASIKSNLQDLDLIEASGRFSLLQTQLQSGLAAAAQVRPLSLLNFLQ